MADWIEKITGDRAPLKDLREWEHRIVAAYSELLDGYKADIPAILNDPEVRAALAKQGVEAEPGTPAALGNRIRADLAKWRDVITSAGIREP